MRRALLLAALLAAGCAPPRGHPLVDLAAELPAAEVRREPTLVDLGTPAARPLLGGGWYWDETDGEGATFVWSSGPYSEVSLFVLEPRRLTLTLAGRPFAAPGKPPQTVTVEVGGSRVAEITVRPGEERWSVDLPEAALEAGDNRLTLVYGWSLSPAALGLSGDRRALAMAWDWLGFSAPGGRPASSEPVRAEADGTLVLPAGSRVDYYLELPENAAIDSSRVEATAGAQLRTSIDQDRGVPRLPGFEVAHLRLEVWGHGQVRVAADALRGRSAREVAPAEAVAVPPARRASSPAQGPPVFLFLVDTLRADRLGAYGSDVGLTPHLDAFAAEAVTFADSVAQASWTKASVASIFTGLWPPSHGAARADDALPAGLPVLPALLGDAGYRTLAVVTNAYVGPAFGFDRGFDRFELLRQHARSDDAVDRFETLLLEEAGAAPLLGYVHTVDPHAPYRPPPDLARRFAPTVADPAAGALERVNDLVNGRSVPGAKAAEELAALYDAEVAANDRQFGRFVAALRGAGLYDGAVIVFLSDHGEAFDDHGTWSHGQTLYSEMVATPLLVRLPGGRHGGLVVTESAQHADLLPTLLELVGVPAPERLDGESLLPRIAAAATGGAALPARAIASHLDYFGKSGVSLIFGEWKLIEPLSASFGAGRELYHRASDPGETRNLAAARPILAGYLAAELRRRLVASTPPPTERGHIDDDTRARLQALGYLE